MYAVEFEADVIDGKIELPESCRELQDRHLRFIALIPDEQEDREFQAAKERANQALKNIQTGATKALPLDEVIARQQAKWE